MTTFDEAVTYFGQFRQRRLEDLRAAMLEYRVGGGSGYGHFPGSADVAKTMRDIFYHLEETFSDLRIPGRTFSTQASLLATWRNFRDYLETRGEIFHELRPRIVEEGKRGVIGNADDFEDIDFLPEPYVAIDRIREEVLEAVNETLAKAEADPSMTSITPGTRLTRLLERFHRVALQLRRRSGGRATLVIEDEYDVQDLLHALLKSEFEDVRAEDHAPQYAGGASRIDFVLPVEGIAVEVKKTRPTLRDKQVGEELIIDAARYRSHPSVSLLHCFVYDPDGFIQNPSGLKSDLEALTGRPEVRVTIAPQR